ncbi:MAG TPA: hypothetical protein VJ750_09110 [Rhizomicrobium sp.]|nr:hypothetical protein [Rhizomicrobium sp.]
MNEGGDMTTAQFLTVVAPFVVTILLVFGMRYGSAVLQARARLAEESRYRALAEKATAAQAESEAALQAIRSDLSRVAASLASLERILKQVE